MYDIVWGHLYVGSGRHLGRWGGSVEVAGTMIYETRKSICSSKAILPPQIIICIRAAAHNIRRPNEDVVLKTEWSCDESVAHSWCIGGKGSSRKQDPDWHVCQDHVQSDQWSASFLLHTTQKIPLYHWEEDKVSMIVQVPAASVWECKQYTLNTVPHIIPEPNLKWHRYII